MIANQITDSDMIILHSVESYLNKQGVRSTNPQEQLFLTQQARDYLYSEIVPRIPRVARYIMSVNDMSGDKVAEGLFLSISNHVMDPVFVNLLMMSLSRVNNPEDNGIVGAFLTKIMNKIVERRVVTPPAEKVPSKKDKDKEKTAEPAPKTPSYDDIEHIRRAINQLLSGLIHPIMMRCADITETEATAIAACIAMNNIDTVKQVIASNIPVTAQIFDIVTDPSEILRSALLLEEADYSKLTKNQEIFIDSLRVWVYNKLNIISALASYQFLVAVYGSVNPNLGKYLIQIRDCGSSYSTLRDVAKQFVTGHN